MRREPALRPPAGAASGPGASARSIEGAAAGAAGSAPSAEPGLANGSPATAGARALAEAEAFATASGSGAGVARLAASVPLAGFAAIAAPVPLATSTPLGGTLPLATPAQAVAATVQLATARGFSHARLALNPPELGGVEVLLRSSSAGLVATLTADSPEAARLLDSGAADLRRQLEAQGVDLLRVDVGVAGDRQSAAGGPGHDGATTPPGSRAPTAANAAATHPDDATPTHRIDLGGGVLIDVIA